MSAAVRIHADRVHDFVRRLGCSPIAAVEVVETSALDLVDAVATNPASVPDVVGWWFGRARALGQRVAGDLQELPLGGGLLSADEDQALLAEALEVLPERERVALLLRDSYALPATAVGVALGTDAEAGMETVGRARLSFLAAVGDAVPTTSGHPVQLGVLARLGEGGPVAAADATARRHAQSCPVCRRVWDSETRAHTMLAGLTVVALPEEHRAGVLDRVDAQGRTYLPAAASLLVDDDEDLLDEPSGRWLVPLYALLALIAAVVVGAVLGFLLSRGGGGSATAAAAPSDPGVLPQVTAAPLPSAKPLPTSFPSPSGPQPSPRVFLVTPTPSPGSAVQPGRSNGASSAPEPAGEPLTLVSSPTSGPNGATLTIQGTGWLPRGSVTLDYIDPLGRQTGSHATATVDARGRFTTTISAQDPANLPGRHVIRASDGTHADSATYDVSG